MRKSKPSNKQRTIFFQSPSKPQPYLQGQNWTSCSSPELNPSWVKPWLPEPIISERRWNYLDQIRQIRADALVLGRVQPLQPTKREKILLNQAMYECDSKSIKKAECSRFDAFELWCWRRLLRVPQTTRRSNQSILKEISPGCSLEGCRS